MRAADIPWAVAQIFLLNNLLQEKVELRVQLTIAAVLGVKIHVTIQFKALNVESLHNGRKAKARSVKAPKLAGSIVVTFGSSNSAAMSFK